MPTSKLGGRTVRMSAALIVVAAMAVLGAASDRAAPTSAEQSPSAIAVALPSADGLSFGFLPDPDFGAGYTTDGSYPQVYGRADLKAVNTALKQAVLADEAQTKQDFAGLYQATTAEQTQPGLYATYPREGLLYANRSIVSVLIPKDSTPPGGNDGEAWISATLIVPAGRNVQVTDLFTKPGTALQTLRTLVGDDVIASSPCVAANLVNIGSSVTGPITSLQPNATTFEDFALSPYGLTFGFEQGMFADEACGAATATVSWESIQPMLSPLGTAIEEDVTS